MRIAVFKMTPYVAVLAGVLLLAAGCGGGGGDKASDKATDKATDSPGSIGTMSSDPSGDPSAGPSQTPTRPPMITPRMKQLSSKQAIGTLRKAGYDCTMDVAYAVCKGSSPVQVWVLAGEQPRFPVLSLHADGSVDTARAAVGAELPKLLRLMHVNELLIIDQWYGLQKDLNEATTNIGDWRINLSAESGTDAPGVHLVLNDKRCKQACQAE